MDTIGKLEEIFRHFPGIGPRQAKRFAYYLLTQTDSDLLELSRLITELKKNILVCSDCQRFFPIGNTPLNAASPAPKCAICSDPNRDHEMLMVVSRDIDMQAVERSRAYNGMYFILGGTVPILEPSPADKIRQKELLGRIEALQANGGNLKEVILATSVNPEGEHTAEYLGALLKSKTRAKISTLGRGLSTGTELEYSDSETLKSALQNRR